MEHFLNYHAHDCMGNWGAVSVECYQDRKRRIVATFAADIYINGDHARAKAQAETLARELNAA